MKWTAADVADQSGRIAIVTGSNTGIGYDTARVLATKGARVILACRNRERGEDAVERIRATGPSGSAALSLLDLSSLDSVRSFAAAFVAENTRLDLLINNAGVMIPPLSKTREGFELQFGVNYLGHFALSGLLFDVLSKTEGARIVTVSSLAHRNARIDFASFRGEQPYSPWRAYTQSKLACLMFSLELHRRLKDAKSPVVSAASHPGGTYTDLQRHNAVLSFFTRLAAMPSHRGALPTLYAALHPNIRGGEYIGPRGPYELLGHPGVAKIARQALDESVAARLWEESAQETGVQWLENKLAA